MHKAIASLFVSITSLLHLIVAAGFALFLYLAVTQGLEVEYFEVNNFTPAMFGALITICIAVYVLVFGFLSLIIRMHQNLDKMNQTLERIAEAQEDLVETFTEDQSDDTDEEIPSKVQMAPLTTSPRASTAMRQEPVLRRPTT